MVIVDRISLKYHQKRISEELDSSIFQKSWGVDLLAVSILSAINSVTQGELTGYGEGE